ncbi:high mobility group box domain-containing protein [Globomyces pollinis-pini]|nr:high mobility group box domain-containing protein [Globomyces pollinis-pini]
MPGGIDEEVNLKRKRGVKKVRDPNQPKLPLSSYLLYVRDQRIEMKDADIHMDPKAILQEIGKRWQSLDAESKQEYIEEAAILKDQYKKDLEKYKASLLLTGEESAEDVPESEEEEDDEEEEPVAPVPAPKKTKVTATKKPKAKVVAEPAPTPAAAPIVKKTKKVSTPAKTGSSSKISTPAKEVPATPSKSSPKKIVSTPATTEKPKKKTKKVVAESPAPTSSQLKKKKEKKKVAESE